MIVQGQKVQTIDVEINPISFLSDLEQSWKYSIGVRDSDIKAGYWVSYIIDGNNGIVDIRGRLATPSEINIYKAFETLSDVASCLE